MTATLKRIYTEWTAAHPHAAEDFHSTIEDLLVDAGVAFDRVTVRVKDLRSLNAKAAKRDSDGNLIYPDPWADIHDVVGVRVTTYHSTEIPTVLSVLQDSFILEKSVDKAEETKISGGFGYGSHHLTLTVPQGMQDLEDYADFTFEVQVRTVLQHAWAEFEHDIRYKRPADALDPRIDRAFTLAAGLIELADQQFDQIAAIKEVEAAETRERDQDEHTRDVAITADMLPGMLATILGNRFSSSRTSTYPWLEEILEANGITTLGELRDLLKPTAIDHVERAIRYRFSPGQARIVDDLLLHRFGTQHIERTAKIGKNPRSRLAKLKNRIKMLQSEQN